MGVQKFNYGKLQYTPIEGVGIAGTYFVQGYIVLRNGNLVVGASGKTAASQSGRVFFSGKATLNKNGQEVGTVNLAPVTYFRNPKDEWQTIGEAAFNAGSSDDSYSIDLKILYYLQLAGGGGVPMGDWTETVTVNNDCVFDADADDEDEEDEEDDGDADPPEVTYTIQPGDTLTRIARKFGTDVDSLVSWNDIDDPDVINAGDDLIIFQE